MALNTSIRGAQIKEAFAGDGLTISGGVMSVGVDGTTITIVGDTLQANASALDHGTLAGLTDIVDHPYASLIDGTRAFTAVVGGIDPTADAHLATKKYVDDNTTATGVIDHGGLLGLADNDHTQYLMTGTAPLAVTGQDVALTILAADLAVNGSNQLFVVDSGIDHGSVGGLGGDDHTQYSLADGTRAYTGVVGGITPTSTAHLTTKGYVDGLIQGLDWKDSVLSITTEYGDASASGTNRYIAPSTSGTWTDDYVYEWNGASWTEVVPNEGAAAWIEDANTLKVYNGSDWVTFGSNIDHNNLSGLQGGTGGEYYHLTSSDFADLVTNQRETVEDYVGAMISGTQTNIDVTYSDNGGNHGDLNYVVATATTSVLGVAKFNDSDFTVTAGDVTLDDDILRDIGSDSGDADGSGHKFTIAGGEGIDTSGAGSTITIAGEDATTANKGIASFDSNHFSVTAGAASIAADAIDETLVDWGSVAGQVDATSLPTGDTWGGTAVDTDAALEELRDAQAADFKFKTFSVAGQSDVVADTVTDTMTLVGGTDVTITTNAGSDTITIASSGSSALTASLGVERVVDDFRADLLAGGGIKLTGNEIGVEPNDFAGDGLEDDGSDNLRLKASVAGAGMTHTAGVLNVIGGNGITANADDIALSASVAGAGMTHTAGVLNVIGGNGITANADDIELSSTVPGDGLTMTAGVINVIGGHGITANADDIELSAGVPGTGLTMTSGVVNVIGGDGITANANEIEVTPDNSTIELSAADGTGTVRVKDLGITNAKIANDTIAEAKLDIHNAPVDTYYLQYDTTNGMQWTDVTSSGVTESDYKLENESSACNGSTTAFTLDATPVSNSLQVYLNGLLQEKGSGKDYTHSGTTVTFSIAPLTNDILLIHYITQS